MSEKAKAILEGLEAGIDSDTEGLSVAEIIHILEGIELHCVGKREAIEAAVFALGHG